MTDQDHPALAALDSNRTGVELDGGGYVKVNECLETTASSVWTMGDCTGSPLFTHVACDDFRVVRDNLMGGKRTTQHRLIPFCIFTDPELVRVGLNETEAKSRGVDYRVARCRWPLFYEPGNYRSREGLRRC